LTTHYMEEAEALCDRVIIIDHGKIVAEGTPRELISSIGGEQVIELWCTPSLEPAAMGALPSVVHARATETGSLRFSVKELHLALPAVLAHVSNAGAQLEQLATRHATLD